VRSQPVTRIVSTTPDLFSSLPSSGEKDWRRFLLAEYLEAYSELDEEHLKMRRYRAEILAGLLLVALTLAALGRVCGNDFVNYDDGDYVTDNRHVQAGLTAESIAWAFTTTHAANWHPLTWLSLQLDHQVYGMAPWGYHLTNLLLHLANTLLLFVALRRMTGVVWRSALVAALFAVHPLHVESVAWVSERKDVLSTLFWMLTLLAYARYCERPAVGRYLPVPLFLALGLMAKPMLVTLPCVLMLLDYWPLRRLGFPLPASTDSSGPAAGVPFLCPPASWRLLLLEKLPLFALVVASCAVTVFAQRLAMYTLEAMPIQSRVVNALTAYIAYIGKTFWPFNLAALYPFPRTWFYWQLVVALGLLVSVAGLALRRARRQPYFLVGWLWYLGTLVPVIGLVQVGKQQMADRYTYIPLVGLFVLLVWGVADLLAHSPRRRPLLIGLSALVLLPCAALSWRQAGTWRDAASLWTQALDATTDNGDACVQVGSVLEMQGQQGRAIALYREALRIDGNNPTANQHLGNLLAKQGKLEEAARYYAASLRVKPDDAVANNNCGVYLFQEGKLGEAILHYQAALRIDPGYATAHNNLGAALGKQGKFAEARQCFREALRLDPRYAEAHYNMGLALEREGKLSEAIECYRKAMSLEPGTDKYRQQLAFALGQQEQKDAAPAPDRGVRRPDSSGPK